MQEIERRERRTRDVCIPKPSKCMYLRGKSPNRRSYHYSNLYTYVSRVASLIGSVSLSAHSQTPTYYPDATGVQYSPSLSLSLSQPSPEEPRRQTNRVRTTILQSIIKSKSNHVHQHPLPQTHRPLSTSPSDPPIPLLPQSRPSSPTRRRTNFGNRRWSPSYRSATRKSIGE